MDKKAIIKEIISWIELVVIAFVIALLLNKFIIINANVPTGSMESTIAPGDRLFGFRLAYINHGPKRGDIIMFNYPVDETEIYIKRVIGLPGEKVEIKNAKVYIDDSTEPLDETYLKEDWVIKNDGMVFQVPQGYYFMMGDNRNNSLDGRYWAEEAVMEGLVSSEKQAVEEKYCFVSDDKILGKAIVRYYPSIKNMKENPFE